MFNPNKTNSKPLEQFVEVENNQEHKSSDEGVSLHPVGTNKNISESKMDGELKKDLSIVKSKKKFLEDGVESEKAKELVLKYDKEKEKKSISKEDIQKFNKNDNIKIEEDDLMAPLKKRRGRPRKIKDLANLKKAKLHGSFQPHSFLPKNKMIKIEGTVKLDLTLFLE